MLVWDSNHTRELLLFTALSDMKQARLIEMICFPRLEFTGKNAK
jgi:hypothetical protein